MIQSSPEDRRPISRPIVSSIEERLSSRSAPFVVSLSGGSSTGKSTQVLAQLAKTFADRIAVVPLDCMMGSYIDRENLDPQYRWDHPDCYGLPEIRERLESLRQGKGIHLPIYDFVTQQNIGIQPIEAKPLIVVEGLYADYGPLEGFANFSIYVEANTATRLTRRCFRNMYERYQLPDPSRTIEGFFRSVLPAHKDFVSQQRQRANLVLEIPYRFSETLARFECRSWEARNSANHKLWAKIEGARLMLGPEEAPSLSLFADDGRCYFECQLSATCHRALLSANPYEL